MTVTLMCFDSWKNLVPMDWKRLYNLVKEMFFFFFFLFKSFFFCNWNGKVHRCPLVAFNVNKLSLLKKPIHIISSDYFMTIDIFCNVIIFVYLINYNITIFVIMYLIFWLRSSYFYFVIQVFFLFFFSYDVLELFMTYSKSKLSVICRTNRLHVSVKSYTMNNVWVTSIWFFINCFNCILYKIS